MARQNYQHGKRLREIAKKQKREEKAQRRGEKKTTPGAGPPIEGEEIPAPPPPEPQPGS